MKLIYTSMLRSILVLSLFPAQSIAGPGDDEQVVLQSKDGQDFKVEVKVAKKSETIKGLIEDSGVGDPIPLPNITGRTLTKIVEFMKYATERPFGSDRALFVYLREFLDEKVVSTTELLDVVNAVNYLDIRSRAGDEHKNDVLFAALKLYGDRIFGHVELEKLKGTSPTSYAAYAKEKLSLPEKELEKIIVKQGFPGIDRIFLDTSPDRRIHAMETTPLAVAQIIAYIAKNQIPSAAELPEAFHVTLVQWQEAFASKIHFGPWPTEIATWPSHCPLPSDPNYSMYSDATPNDRYIDNGDGTITDICTNLTWEQTPSTPAAPWQQAKDSCAKLSRETQAKRRKTDQGFENNGTQTAWRAPTWIELQSIVNYAAMNPALNPIFQEGNARYWSSTPKFGFQNQTWTVNFAQGWVGSQAIAEINRMRCVRGEQGGPQTVGAKRHYTYAAGSETVTDNFTGAVWQRRLVDVRRNQAASQTYCQNLALDGVGWQLPTVKALSTLVDMGVDAPRIDRAAFPGTPVASFWSSSPRVGVPISAWFVLFDLGDVLNYQVDLDVRARCVR